MSCCHQLPGQLEWYKIRDTLLGFNDSTQNVTKAIRLAAVCEYPDAVWLTKLFAGRDVATPMQVTQVFLASKDDDARALCFAGLLCQNTGDVRRAANLGNKVDKMCFQLTLFRLRFCTSNYGNKQK